MIAEVASKADVVILLVWIAGWFCAAIHLITRHITDAKAEILKAIREQRTPVAGKEPK